MLEPRGTGVRGLIIDTERKNDDRKKRVKFQLYDQRMYGCQQSGRPNMRITNWRCQYQVGTKM